jgi:hypothetical protein
MRPVGAAVQLVTSVAVPFREDGFYGSAPQAMGRRSSRWRFTECAGGAVGFGVRMDEPHAIAANRDSGFGSFALAALDAPTIRRSGR